MTHPTSTPAPQADERDPFAEGREAHDTGQPETANPYDDQEDEFLTWNDGWSEAHQEMIDED